MFYPGCFAPISHEFFVWFKASHTHDRIEDWRLVILSSGRCNEQSSLFRSNMIVKCKIHRAMIMRTLIIGIFVSLFCSTVQALPESGQNATFAGMKREPLSLVGQRQVQLPGRVQHLAETAKETASQPAAPPPESGSLVIPGDEDQKEKKCLTICKRWGEDCIINPRTGNRDCRRTCKEFGEECF